MAKCDILGLEGSTAYFGSNFLYSVATHKRIQCALLKQTFSFYTGVPFEHAASRCAKSTALIHRKSKITHAFLIASPTVPIPSSVQSLLLWHGKKYLGLMCLVSLEKHITLICCGWIEKRHRIPLPCKTHRETSMVARLEGTKLERSGKGNVPRFLACSGEVMRREGRTQQKQGFQNMYAAFQDGLVEQKAFLPHGQEHDRSVKFSETVLDLYCCLPDFIYCMSITLFL